MKAFLSRDRQVSLNAFCVNSPLQNNSIYLDKMYSINIELWIKTWKKCVEKQGKLLIIQWGNVIVDVLKFVHKHFWNAFKMFYFFISHYKVEVHWKMMQKYTK